nr:hypothetical protein [uncultured Acinetobacter sp.]
MVALVLIANNENGEMKKLFLCLALATFSAFANAEEPKGVKVQTSGFDGTKEVTLKPYGSSSCMSFSKTCISVGALWKSNLPDKVALDLHSLGKFVNMTDLFINVDGEIVKADRVSFANDHQLTGHYKESFQRFVIPKDVFNKILSAQKVWLKIETTSGSYIETNLIDSGKSTLALDGLKRFATQL